jgi:GT2 family glycosyltransferase
MKTPSTDIAFIILTWNSQAYIEKCLDSLLSALAQTDLRYHIYITDNGSTDGTPDILHKLKQNHPSAVTLFFLDRNMGTTYSRNLGLKQAAGRYICIMDSDVELQDSTVIHKLISNLENHPSIGLTAPKMVFPNGKRQKTTDSFPTIFRKITRYFFLRKMESFEAQAMELSKPIQVDYAISAFWMMRNDLFEKIGYLDENIFYSPEDVDFCLRIWKAGYGILYDPSVCAVHHTQEISRSMKFNSAFFHHIKGLCYYFIKHRYFLFPPAFRTKSR